MTPKTAITELRARVEGATEASRELFIEIARSVVADYAAAIEWRSLYNGFIGCEAWTDAALALMERVRPGFCWRVHRQTPAEIEVTNGQFWATCGVPGAQEDSRGEIAPLALLSAFFRALEAEAGR